MDTQAQQLELKRLIIKGKEQGFLTYREINDHLPGDMNDTDQIETVVNMINDMGIAVHESAPESDDLLVEGDSTDELAAEEAAAAAANMIRVIETTAKSGEIDRISVIIKAIISYPGCFES